MRLVDLSQTVSPEMPRFSTLLPKPAIKPWMSHSQSSRTGAYQDCTCEITQVHLITTLGTYLSSPFHFDPVGPTVDQLALEKLVLPGVTIDCTGARPLSPIGPDVLEGITVTGKAVLFRTDWSDQWGEDDYKDFPFLAAETAATLRGRGAKLVGVDTLMVDNPDDPRRPANNILLQSNILVVENLKNLRELPASGYLFHAVPPKIAGAASFPVRAYAVMR